MLGTALSRSLRHYWIRGGHLALGLHTTAEALARLPANDRSLQRLQALFDMGQLHSFAAQYGQAQRYLEECIAIARELGLRREVGFGLQPLALALLGLGRIAEARACYEEGVEIAREGGDANEVAAALNGLGQIERMQGDLAAAERLLQEALTLASRAGHHYTMRITMLNLAIVWIEGGEKERARSVLREILAQIEEGGAASLAQSALEVTAAFASFLGDWDAAARFYGAAEATAVKTGLRRGAADDAFLIKRVDEARRRLDPAAFESREKEGRALPAGMAVQLARAWLEKA